VKEIAQYMERENSNDNKMPKNTKKSPLPSVELWRIQIGATSNFETPSDDYNHAMKCINGLAETMSSLVSSIKPLVIAWNKARGFNYLDEVSSFSFPCNHLFT
jgi:hypothetical protein